MPIEILNFARDAAEAQLEPQDSTVFNFTVKNTFGPVVKCVNVTIEFQNIPAGLTISPSTTIPCGDLLPDQSVQKSITITTNIAAVLPTTGADYTIDVVPHYSIVALSYPTPRTVTVHVAKD